MAVSQFLYFVSAQSEVAIHHNVQWVLESIDEVCRRHGTLCTRREYNSLSECCSVLKTFLKRPLTHVCHVSCLVIGVVERAVVSVLRRAVGTYTSRRQRQFAKHERRPAESARALKPFCVCAQ